MDTGIVHAQHHQLYVSYAYGAVYAHWLESIFLDIVSFVLANTIAGLSARQSMVFGSFATIKTISDHCGYVFPLDLFRYVNNNGAKFHDLHHQTWGLKVRLSRVFASATLSMPKPLFQRNPSRSSTFARALYTSQSPSCTSTIGLDEVTISYGSDVQNLLSTTFLLTPCFGITSWVPHGQTMQVPLLATPASTSRLNAALRRHHNRPALQLSK